MKIELTVNEVNYILQTLATRPLGEALDVWAKVKSQAEAQAAAQQEPPKE